MGRKCYEFVWEKADYCIFLEDDIVPTVSYFEFCAELLEKYRYDTRICSISGNNQLESWDKCPYDYFFSKEGSISGYATWKRCFEMFYDFSFAEDDYSYNIFRNNLKLYKNKCLMKQTEAFINYGVYEGHVDGSEYWLSHACYGQSQVHIVSKKNMIRNIGFEASEHIDSANRIPNGISKLFDLNTYDVTFPLNEPPLVLADLEYEKARNRALGYNNPWIVFWRRICRVCLIVKSGDVAYLTKKLKLVIKRTHNVRLEK
ncbi:MAG TPA: hypothetical protein DHV96_05940 [Lachnospiraceae bacterium]|nr:hypothetical protein [Lachnospiraceae bacterium]